MANQIESAPAAAGSMYIRIPLRTKPLATDTMNAAFGFIRAWK